MSTPMDSPTGPAAWGTTPLSSPSTSSLNTPAPVLIPPSITAGPSPSPSFPTSPAPLPSSTAYSDLDGLVFVLTDGNGIIYTTTIYSTQNPSPPTSTLASNLKVASTGGFSAVIAAIGGGVGLLFLLVGVILFIRVRRAKRRAAMSTITDRKFYPDRYNQTVTSNRHSEYNEIEPGPVVVQPLPPLLLHQTTSLSSGPLSRQTSLYQGHISFSRAREDWAGDSLPDGVLKDIPPLTRHRVPYPNSPPQLPIDRYTMLPSRSISTSNPPGTPLRFAHNLPPRHPHHVRSSPSTHRRHHSDHDYHNRPQHRGHNINHLPQIPFPNPSPSPKQMTRRNTVFVSPSVPPYSFSFLSGPPEDLLATRVESTTTTLKSRLSIARSISPPTDPLAVVNETTKVRRMMCTNPDSDVDLETDTEPDEPGRSGNSGSPSATDIILLYGRNQDQDASSTNSTMGEKDPPTVSVV